MLVENIIHHSCLFSPREVPLYQLFENQFLCWYKNGQRHDSLSLRMYRKVNGWMMCRPAKIPVKSRQLVISIKSFIKINQIFFFTKEQQHKRKLIEKFFFHIFLIMSPSQNVTIGKLCFSSDRPNFYSIIHKLKSCRTDTRVHGKLKPY